VGPAHREVVWAPSAYADLDQALEHRDDAARLLEEVLNAAESLSTAVHDREEVFDVFAGDVVSAVAERFGLRREKLGRPSNMKRYAAPNVYGPRSIAHRPEPCTAKAHEGSIDRHDVDAIDAVSPPTDHWWVIACVLGEAPRA